MTPPLPPDVEPIERTDPMAPLVHAPLINQPTNAPTRKIAAVGLAGLAVPIVSGFLVANIDGLTQACGDQVALAMTVAGFGLAQGGLTFLTGYYKRNRATDVGR